MGTQDNQSRKLGEVALRHRSDENEDCDTAAVIATTTATGPQC